MDNECYLAENKFKRVVAIGPATEKALCQRLYLLMFMI